MVSPNTLAQVSLGGTAAGAGISTVGSFLQGKSQADLYQYRAGLSLAKKQIDLQNRDFALQSGESEAQNYGLRSRFQAGGIKAAQGASNLDVGSGSMLDVQRGQKLVSDIDMANIRTNAARRAYGFETQAAMDEAEAGLYDKAAKGAFQGGLIKSAASLVSGATSVSDKWLQLGQYGLDSGGGS